MNLILGTIIGAGLAVTFMLIWGILTVVRATKLKELKDDKDLL